MAPTRWLRIAGVLTWLVGGLPGILAIAGGRLPATLAITWALAFGAFGVAFLVYTSERPRPRAVSITLLAIQSLSGLLTVAMTGRVQEGATLVIVAAQLPHSLKTRHAVTWVVVQSVLLAALFWRNEGPTAAIVGGGAFGGFQMFAITTAWLARSEGLARQDLARTVAELRATRELLAQNTRVAERLRISRDLHDTLGHHLTALSLQLDVASRTTEGPAAARIREAHAITRLLLADVREVVSELRQGTRLDLEGALRALAPGRGTPSIHFEMPDRLDVEDPAQGDALLRCVQELITNAARHAQAGNLWIRIDQRPDGIELHAHDDGRGTSAVTWGHGLTGMRERFEASAGRIDVRSSDGHGFEVHGFLPRREALA